MKYKQEIWKRIWGKVKVRYQFGLLVLAATIVGLYVVFRLEIISSGYAFAQGNLLNNVLTVAVVEILSFVFILLWVRFYGVPAEIYDEQKAEIDSRGPNKLRLFVDQSIVGGKEVGDEHVQAIRLFVVSQEKQKLVDFHVLSQELLQRVATMPADVRGRTFHHPIQTTYFAWDSGVTHRELNPGVKAQLEIAEFDPKTKRPAFGEEKFQSDQFAQEAIYEFHARFMGKLEGEMEFRYFDYKDEVYSKPDWETLEFASQTNLPDELKPKYFRVNKAEQDE